ncbi:MAG: class IV adenylate cyclase [Desulfurococcaceae archaeon]
MVSKDSREVEIKLSISEPDYARSLLESLGFRRVDTCLEEDYYFNHPCRNFAESDEALRLRKRICGLSRSYVLTYKGPRERDSSNFKIREEIEVFLDEKELSNIFTILEKLGFKLITRFTKRREIYSGRGLNASIDLLSGVGYYLELELGIHGERGCLESIVQELNKKLGAVPVEKTYLEICIETRKCI